MKCDATYGLSIQEVDNREAESMTYRGRVTNGVVVLEGDARLPEGTEVSISPLDEQPMPVSSVSAYHLAEFATPTGIEDLALNVDHYLYGHPKVDDASR